MTGPRSHDGQWPRRLALRLSAIGGSRGFRVPQPPARPLPSPDRCHLSFLQALSIFGHVTIFTCFLFSGGCLHSCRLPEGRHFPATGGRPVTWEPLHACLGGELCGELSPEGWASLLK